VVGAQYNILLGVEHFYVYYNAHSVLHDPKLEQSQLKSFLAANPITLVYFPFLHTVRFNNQTSYEYAYAYRYGFNDHSQDPELVGTSNLPEAEGNATTILT